MFFLPCKLTNGKTHRQYSNGLKTFETKTALFIVFDVESFYPSISPQIFHKAINYVKTIRDIPDNDISIIMQSRRTFLLNNKGP